jgi:glycosyltransferase involved in cell wall biosynthesis
MADPSLPAESAASRAKRPTASVALATYNGGAFIGAQIDSILAQTELPDEIVVTDDQSEDDTIPIVTAYASRSPVPIRVHRNPQRLGFARNFRKASDLCRSELIFFCDQDDLWTPAKVETVKTAFSDRDVFLVYHGALVITAENEPLYPLYDASRQLSLLATKPMDPWHATYGLTQAFRASLRDHDDLWERSRNHIGYEEELLAHDQWYYFLAQIFGRVVYIDEPLVHYRQHGGNAVGAAHYSKATGVLQRIRQQLDHDPRIDRLKYDAALRRADILGEIGHRAEGEVVERARIAAQFYSALAARLRRRYRTYVSESPWERAAKLGRMVRHADYGPRPWLFTKRSVVRDLVRGVLGREMGSENREAAREGTRP